MPQSDDPQRTAENFLAHHFSLQFPTSAASDLLLIEKPFGKRQHEEERCRGSGVIERHGSVKERDVEVSAGGNVDLIVPGPRTADDDQALPGTFECGAFDPRTEHDQSVAICQVLRGDLQRVKPLPVLSISRPRGEIAQKLVFDVRRGIQQIERQSPVCVGPAVVENVAGNGESEAAQRSSSGEIETIIKPGGSAASDVSLLASIRRHRHR